MKETAHDRREAATAGEKGPQTYGGRRTLKCNAFIGDERDLVYSVPYLCRHWYVRSTLSGRSRIHSIDGEFSNATSTRHAPGVTGHRYDRTTHSTRKPGARLARLARQLVILVSQAGQFIERKSCPSSRCAQGLGNRNVEYISPNDGRVSLMECCATHSNRRRVDSGTETGRVAVFVWHKVINSAKGKRWHSQKKVLMQTNIQPVVSKRDQLSYQLDYQRTIFSSYLKSLRAASPYNMAAVQDG